MARVTILNFKHQLRKPKALLNVCFSFLPGTLVMEPIIYHFWRDYRASEKEGQGGVSHSESLSMPCWSSAGKFYLQGVFLGNSCPPSQHFFLASFSGYSSTNLHRTKPILQGKKKPCRDAPATGLEMPKAGLGGARHRGWNGVGFTVPPIPNQPVTP